MSRSASDSSGSDVFLEEALDAVHLIGRVDKCGLHATVSCCHHSGNTCRAIRATIQMVSTPHASSKAGGRAGS